MTNSAECTEACTNTPDCTMCGRRKKLVGRDYPAAMGGGYCDHECPGYRDAPAPGHLWWSEWLDIKKEHGADGP